MLTLDHINMKALSLYDTTCKLSHYKSSVQSPNTVICSESIVMFTYYSLLVLFLRLLVICCDNTATSFCGEKGQGHLLRWSKIIQENKAKHSLFIENVSRKHINYFSEAETYGRRAAFKVAYKHHLLTNVIPNNRTFVNMLFARTAKTTKS